MLRQFAFSALAVSLLGLQSASAEQVRYYAENGVTYRETRRTVSQRVPEVAYREEARTVYREEVCSENRQMQRVCWQPVTQWKLESNWVNRWNPLAQPYIEHRYVPETRLEPKAETVCVPVQSRRLVPQTQTVRVPVTTYRTVDREIVSRCVVGALPGPAPEASPSLSPSPLNPWGTSPNAALQYGGIARLDDRIPR